MGNETGRRRIVASVLLGAMTLASAAHADEASAQATPAATPTATVPEPGEASTSISPNGESLRVTVGAAVSDVALGCVAKAHARVGKTVYVACGAGGLVRVDLSDVRAPKVTGRAAVDGEAVGVFMVEGRPWVQVARTEARPAEALGWNVGAAQSVAPVPVTAAAPASAEPAAPTPSLIAPPRIGDVWEVAVGTYLFLPLGDIGFGALGHGKVTRRFEAPVALHLDLAPIGVAGGKGGAIGTVVATAALSLDTSVFELGLGIGAATVHDRGSRASVAVSQLARVGAVDGLALFVRSTIVVERSEFQTDPEFTLGGLEITGQIPLHPEWQLLLRGGGGSAGFAYGDIGARHRLGPGPRAMGITGAVGGASVFGSTKCQAPNGANSFVTDCQSRTYGGPALHIAADWRF